MIIRTAYADDEQSADLQPKWQKYNHWNENLHQIRSEERARELPKGNG